MNPLGEDSWKLKAGFLWTSAHVLCPLLILRCVCMCVICVYLSMCFLIYDFAVINHSHKYNYMPSSVSSPSESSNLGVALGTPTHHLYKKCFQLDHDLM